MTCDVKIKSLDYLKREKVIDDLRFIVDNNLEEFKKKNEYLTKRAEEVYGLRTEGRLLFDVESTSRTYGRDVVNTRTRVKYLATPVEELFETLQDLKNIKNMTEVEKLEIVKNRQPFLTKMYKGTKYQNSDFKHYVINSDMSIEPGVLMSVPNTNFLIANEDYALYKDLVKDFELRRGYQFNINDRTSHSQKMQEEFYEFLQKKGISGLELTDEKGNLNLISFPKSQTIELSDNELDYRSETTESVINQEPVIEPKSTLESLEWYSATEMDKIYENYSTEEINQMIEEDQDNAMKVFNTLLYPDEFINDIFVDNRTVNEQIRKCK